MIEFRSDGGDFAELWIDGKGVLMLNSDINDIKTGELVAKALANAFGLPFVIDNGYEWNRQTGYLEKPTD